MTTPAEQLLNKKLKNDWVVIEKIDLKPEQTGGCFSQGYKVRNKNRTAFLKAMDFHKIPIGNQAQKIEFMTKAFNYEVMILEKCKYNRMSKVVLSIDSGEIGSLANGDLVLYIIFELADNDIRTYQLINTQADSIFFLKTIHSVTVGLQQLHSADIAHQDIKPSNILLFKDDSKIADVGRAISKKDKAPHDTGDFVGDDNYAPFEYLYGDFGSDWTTSKLGADTYMLGGLIVFLFFGVNINEIIKLELDSIYHPENWKDSYEKVLPFVFEAFDKAIMKFKENISPDCIKDDIISMIKNLCYPDPNHRGDPVYKNNLMRVHPRIDLLIKKVEIEIAKNF